MSRKKHCPSCGTRMVADRTSHRTVNPQGRPVLYYNVWRYECPQGCATTTLDFSEASLDPQGRARGYRLAVQAGPNGQIVVTPTHAGPFDLSLFITVLGLILGYVIFAWALIVIPASPMGKIVSTALLTLGAFYVVVHLTAAPGQNQAVVTVNGLEAEAAGETGDNQPEAE